MWNAQIASNLNFPAPLAVVGFLAGCAGGFAALAAILIFWFARKPRLARLTALAMGAGAAIYFALLFGFSVASRSHTLSLGQEKYFCEIDCHLAYSIVSVKEERGAVFSHYMVTLRTRFDETTASASRPKDAPLTPSPREVRLIDSFGRVYTASAIDGAPLLTPLKPAESYTSRLEFHVPKDATGLKLLIHTTPGWPDHLVIGDENSWLHKKTYLAI